MRMRRDPDGTLEWVWVVGRALSRAWVRVHAVGLENVPRTGSVVLAGNHRSHADIPAVVGALDRRVLFAATEDLFEYRFLRWVLETQRCPKVNHRGVDRKALQDSMDMLGLERVLTVFPEGELKPEGLCDFEEGAAYLAWRSGAPLVPFGLAGTLDAWSHHEFPPVRSRHVAMVIGAPLAPNPELARKAAVKDLNERLYAAVEHCIAVAARIRSRATGRV